MIFCSSVSAKAIMSRAEKSSRSYSAGDWFARPLTVFRNSSNAILSSSTPSSKICIISSGEYATYLSGKLIHQGSWTSKKTRCSSFVVSSLYTFDQGLGTGGGQRLEPESTLPGVFASSSSPLNATATWQWRRCSSSSVSACRETKFSASHATENCTCCRRSARRRGKRSSPNL